MAESNIEWTDYTFNPWRGCTKVSAGCTNCYAEKFSRRFPGKMGDWGDQGTRAIAAEMYWKDPVRWNRLAEKEGVRKRVFCASLSDVFEDRPELDEQRSRLFDLIEDTPNLDWLLLTKRPNNIKPMLPAAWTFTMPENVYFGTSVEDQASTNERTHWLIEYSILMDCKFFLSIEPLLAPVDLSAVLPFGCLNWVIVGGESGPNARPMDLQWVRNIRDQCLIACVPFLFKQHGGTNKKAAGRTLDGRVWDQTPFD